MAEVLDRGGRMILAGTGHRPEKLTDNKALCYSNELTSHLAEFAEKHLIELQPEKVISGGALGWDQGLAIAAIRMEIPLIVAVPFLGQDKIWNGGQRRIYQRILEKAEDVVIVSEGDFSPEKMQIRNVWMVDHCDHLLAVWNGTRGGTANCIAYAKKVDRPMTNIWLPWVAYRKNYGL